MALIEHLEKLRHFHTLTQYVSINEAATNTGFSQAGLSKSLILLEQELNCKLFKRSREGLTLTREGAEVLEATKRIIEEADRVENSLRSLKSSSIPRTFRIGMYDSIAVYFGIELQRYLKSVYPKVNMILHSDSSAALVKKLIAGDLDFAVGVNFPKKSDSNIQYHPLFDDSYSYYMSSKLTADSDDLPILLHTMATDGTGIALERILAKDLRGRTIHVINNFETVKSLTQQGLGIGVLPTQVARTLVANKELVNVQLNQQRQLFGRHHIGFLVRTEISESFSDFVQDILRLGTRKIK